MRKTKKKNAKKKKKKSVTEPPAAAAAAATDAPPTTAGAPPPPSQGGSNDCLVGTFAFSGENVRAKLAFVLVTLSGIANVDGCADECLARGDDCKAFSHSQKQKCRLEKTLSTLPALVQAKTGWSRFVADSNFK